MKFAKNKTSAKKTPGNAPAKRAAIKKALAKAAARRDPAATAVAAARESLTESTTSARDAVIATLVNFSPGLVQVNPDGTIIPLGLFRLSFGDPKVGLDDGQMRGFFAAVSTAINDTRVGGLIDAKLGDTDASANIGDVVRLIQLWIDNPDMTA
jgi:hypothetical protein